jgi:cytochrome c-type biogenesis protein CcmE
MLKKHKRLLWLIGGLSFSAIIIYGLFYWLSQHMVYFYEPHDLLTKTTTGTIRLGGYVEPGSVRKDPHKPITYFAVTDHKHTITVAHHGIVPSLFRDNQGVIAYGTFDGCTFTSDKLLVKHDETYKPPKR